jgi:phenylpropionate dioxygenase-like ring-hydroxylating dioxygenase large terminal subunit
MFLKNHWYIGCASLQLLKQPISVKIGNDSIALFRDAQGKPQALRDRCCHRSAKLSKGKIIDNKLECPYHGWQFNAAGECTLIPSMHIDQKIPKTFCVDAFPCLEKHGMIWVWIPEETGTKPTYEPMVEGFENHSWSQGSLPFECNYQLLIEGTLDITHFQYLHSNNRIIKQQKPEQVLLQPELVTSKMGFATTTRSNDGWYRITFQLPGLVVLENFVNGSFNNRSFIFVIPTGEFTCRMEYLIMTPKKSKTSIQWLKKVPEFFQQDQNILAEIQQTFRESGAIAEKSVEADVPAIWSRRVIASALKNQGLNENSEQKKSFEFFT